MPPLKQTVGACSYLSHSGVSHAAGLGGQGKDGHGGPKTVAVSPAVGCAAPSEQVPATSGCGSSAEVSDHSSQGSDLKLAGWFPLDTKAANFSGPPRALGIISVFKDSGQRACLCSLVCGY